MCVCVYVYMDYIAHLAPLSMGFSRQEYWSGLPCSLPGDLPDPKTEPTSLMSPVLAGEFFTTGSTWEAYIYMCVYIYIHTYTHIYIYIYIYMINPWCCKVTNRNIYESLNTQIEISVPDTLELSRTTQDFSAFIYALLLLHHEIDFFFSHYWQHLFSLLMIQ